MKITGGKEQEYAQYVENKISAKPERTEANGTAY